MGNRNAEQWVAAAISDIEQYGIEWAEECYNEMLAAAGKHTIETTNYLVGIKLYKANEAGELND